ncbi:hypothetical protein XAC4311_640083 [Xanthomonas citri pv. citri]|nr:hypothetical protein XAC9322_230154 [Xanthomonas citri pv. citri]CEE55989.1 hypothetical protein XAC71A_280154 [Xanthomonas citri pv. citri]CEI09601.1 hypothetical protein XACG117_670067 [Xanthomonas citri pv. citri]CEL36879.1 hypothetical protein XAC4311_640083 [Xanthomonas citri pv. citri]CEL43977.1 hypothetical protein XAC439_3580003 [Xanthomonas citri pv. citri]
MQRLQRLQRWQLTGLQAIIASLPARRRTACPADERAISVRDVTRRDDSGNTVRGTVGNRSRLANAE